MRPSKITLLKNQIALIIKNFEKLIIMNIFLRKFHNINGYERSLKEL